MERAYRYLLASCQVREMHGRRFEHGGIAGQIDSLGRASGPGYR